MPLTFKLTIFPASAAALLLSTSVIAAQPVPGYVPPVITTPVANYADDTRGVFVPEHVQHRFRTQAEMQAFGQDGIHKVNMPLYAQQQPSGDAYERQLNTMTYGGDIDSEMNRIAADPGTLRAPGMQRPQPDHSFAPQGMFPGGQQLAYAAPQQPAFPQMGMQQGMMQQGMMAQQQMPYVPPAQRPLPYAAPSMPGEGIEIAVGATQSRSLDMENSLVRLREDRISVRRALQRMMDQIGGGNWLVVWDLAEQNAGLPEMEISLYAEEPFVNVLNALLARIQTRSGQPLRVIRYDKTQRLVITDRVGGHRLKGRGAGIGVTEGGEVAVTEQVLRESMVSLHFDEIPLVDALENLVNQAGKGEWRLRVYAGLDQVLKPAHIEEPFGVAMERILRLFNLKYEVFPGGKLIVITHDNKFGFQGQ